MGRDRKPTKQEIAEAEAEIENLRKGGSGKGDTTGKGLAQVRKDVDAEPLNMNPDPKEQK